MTYRLLSNGRGVPLSLASENGNILQLCFENAPRGANAYIKTVNGAVFYRSLVDGRASIDLARITGDIKLGVVTTEVPNTPARWDCGGITVIHTLNGIITFPSASDLAEQVRLILLETEELKNENIRTNEKLAELKKRFEDFFEGYDIL